MDSNLPLLRAHLPSTASVFIRNIVDVVNLLPNNIKTVPGLLLSMNQLLPKALPKRVALQGHLLQRPAQRDLLQNGGQSTVLQAVVSKVELLQREVEDNAT